MFSRNCHFLLCASAALVLSSWTAATQAQTIVAPNSLATTEGGTYVSSAPFNNVSRYQQIYAASEFATLTAPAFITQITFRADASQAAAFSNTLSNVQIDLSTTSQTVTGMSSVFSDNVGADNTIVLNGSLTLSTSNMPGTGTAKQFDIVVDFSTAFLYNPAAGNLLMDIRNASSGFTGLIDATVDTSASPKTRLNFVDNTTTATTGTVQPAGIVTQFTFAPVPAPNSLWVGLFGAAPVLCFWLRRQQRQ